MRKHGIWIAAALGVFALSHWQLAHYWFRYEDLGILYALQHPQTLSELFARSELAPYRAQTILLPWQYALFGYNPFGYIGVSVITALGAGLVWAAFWQRLSGIKMV